LSIELLDGISGRILSSVNTTDRGAFDFGNLAPGLYFIHLKPYSGFFEQVEGLISVAVDPAAPARANKLDLNLTWTSCGLMYTDQLHCPQLNLHVKKLEGHLSDSMGRAVRRAEIILLDATQSQVVHVSTDPNGNFSFGPLVGTFELRIEGGRIHPGARPDSHRTHRRQFISRNRSWIRNWLQHGPNEVSLVRLRCLGSAQNSVSLRLAAASARDSSFGSTGN
jgi:hypothetical protein